MILSAQALFDRIDAGEITPANASDAIEKAGGLAFLIACLLVP